MSTIYHTPISVGAPVNASIVNAPLSQLDAAINTLNTTVTTTNTSIANLIAGVTAFTQLNLGAPTNITITAGVISITKSRHRVDTEGAAATDDLDTINGGAEGDVLHLQIVNSARVVVIKHNTGNIYLSGGLDYTLSDTRERLSLVYDATTARWMQQVSIHPYISGIVDTTRYRADSIRLPDRIIRTSGGFAAANNPLLSIMPRPDKRKFAAEFSSAAAFEALGMAAGTSAGAGALTNSNQTDSSYVNQAIGAVAATFGGRRSTTFNITRRQYNPYFAALMRTDPTITNIRFWVGLCAAQVTNVDTLVTSFFGFRFSTVVPDTNWQAVTNTGAAQTTADTGVVVAASTAYLFELYVDDTGGICYFSVNGSTPVSINATLPAAATDLGWTVTAITTTATAKNILISRAYVDFN